MADTRVVSISIESKGEAWDHVRVQRLSGREAISELFSFDVDVVCDAGHDLPEHALPGDEVSLVIDIDGDEVRRIHGLLGPIRNHLDAPADRATYRLHVVPRVFRLTLVTTQEVYLDRTIPEILKSKLERHDFGPHDFDLRLIGTYAAREIVVQYGESDLAFMRRLAEHAGISFYFEHEDGHDKIVLTDHANGFRPVPGAEEVTFRPRGEADHVYALSVVTDLAPTSYIIQDYNYRTPLVDLSACHDIESGNGGGIVEYGSHVKTPEEAERLARIRAEERVCRQRIYEGKSGAVALSAGRKVTLNEPPRLPGPETMLLVEVTHEATIPVFDEKSSDKASYSNTFRAIPAAVTFRPERRTPRPRIAGLVTGIIQPGPGGETGGVARLDSEGRYTVQIHFDTADPGEQKASHPVRLAQPFTGSNYGMHFPLRPGTEVVLAFANGDPDRPVIVGALYNAASPSPVVAATATKHQLKSSSGAVFEIGSRS